MIPIAWVLINHEEIGNDAALAYRGGHSLKTVADKFNVDTRTLGREFRRAGVDIRPRRGWTY